MTQTIPKPQLSAVDTLIASSSIKSPRQALALEIQHNLQYQHSWRDLRIHALSDIKPEASLDSETLQDNPSSPGESEDEIWLISGLPPRHSYIHPDLQAYLLRHKIAERELDVQREWVLPLSIGETFTLRQFARVFGRLPSRTETNVAVDFRWRDTKRVLLGMLAHNGMGGDGTIAYYIMQEGEVKPRQNG